LTVLYRHRRIPPSPTSSAPGSPTDRKINHLSIYFIIIEISMPTSFFIWGYMYPFTFIFGGTSKFLGVQCTPLTLHLGVQRKLTAFSPRKVAHHAGFCKYYAELAKTFFSVWHWGRQEVGFSLTHVLCVCLTIFL
jgi:hypothetical protein